MAVEILNLEEAAELLGCHPKTLRRSLDTGMGPPDWTYRRLGPRGMFRFSRSALMLWIEGKGAAE